MLNNFTPAANKNQGGIVQSFQVFGECFVHKQQDFRRIAAEMNMNS